MSHDSKEFEHRLIVLITAIKCFASDFGLRNNIYTYPVRYEQAWWMKERVAFVHSTVVNWLIEWWIPYANLVANIPIFTKFHQCECQRCWWNRFSRMEKCYQFCFNTNAWIANNSKKTTPSGWWWFVCMAYVRQYGMNGVIDFIYVCGTFISKW